MPYYTKEQQHLAKQMDLFTYLKNYDPNELIRESRTQYCTREHSSLKISNGFWHWCSKHIGGRNAVKYLVEVKKMEYVDAIGDVLEKMGKKPPVYIKQEEKRVQNLILPEKNNNAIKVVNYLENRGIDDEIIEFCIRKNLIYEDKIYHNVVFLGYDELGNIKYAGRRATNSSKFKSDATGSNKKYSFKLESTQKTNEIFIFEGAIDVLSFASFLKLYGFNWKDKTLISLAGIYQPPKNLSESKMPICLENYLKNHPEITKINLCLDNDEAGRNATKALETILSEKYEVLDKPAKKGKDYNDYLCYFLGIKQEEKSRKNIQERTR